MNLPEPTKPTQAFIDWWRSEWVSADGAELLTGGRTIDTDATILLDWISDTGRCWRAARAAAFEECATIAEGYAIDRCSPAWTDRGFHAPDCPYEIGRDVAAAIRERAKEEK